MLGFFLACKLTKWPMDIVYGLVPMNPYLITFSGEDGVAQWSVFLDFS